MDICHSITEDELEQSIRVTIYRQERERMEIEEDRQKRIRLTDYPLVFRDITIGTYLNYYTSMPVVQYVDYDRKAFTVERFLSKDTVPWIAQFKRWRTIHAINAYKKHSNCIIKNG